MICEPGAQLLYCAFISGVKEKTIGHASDEFTSGLIIGHTSKLMGTVTVVAAPAVPADERPMLTATSPL
jgi:hypothetical protein